MCGCFLADRGVRSCGVSDLRKEGSPLKVHRGVLQKFSSTEMVLRMLLEQLSVPL